MEVVPFPRREADALFTAPSNVHKLQADESLKRDLLAEHLAALGFNRSVKELPPSAQADCRYLACHALRMLDRNWKDAALHAALKACESWLEHEGGKAFRHLTAPQREAIALFLVPKVLTAFQSISEGSGAMLPGRYLAIIEGRGL